jgi:hypothetical protein
MKSLVIENNRKYKKNSLKLLNYIQVCRDFISTNYHTPEYQIQSKAPGTHQIALF